MVLPRIMQQYFIFGNFRPFYLLLAVVLRKNWIPHKMNVLARSTHLQTLGVRHRNLEFTSPFQPTGQILNKSRIGTGRVSPEKSGSKRPLARVFGPMVILVAGSGAKLYRNILYFSMDRFEGRRSGCLSAATVAFSARSVTRKRANRSNLQRRDRCCIIQLIVLSHNSG